MERPVLTVSEGKLQGTTITGYLNNKYLAFRGIPYAKPPLGTLRFKPPVPAEKWQGIRDASQYASHWPVQLVRTFGTQSYEIIGSEDCLYLNVYTKQLGTIGKPVMFYIHGGYFIKLSANGHNREDYFVTQDLVLVMANFRLGALGFLNLGHDEASGNQGIKDIVLALKWVQKNIHAFGGDSGNVTIFGNSSGSIICHLLMILPKMKGLFHKAILQSGSVLRAHDLIKDLNGDFKNGFKIASKLGLDSTDPVEVIEFLRKVPAIELITVQTDLLSTWERIVKRKNLEFGPTYDGSFSKDPLIPAPLKDLLRNDIDIPIIIGDTLNEALLSLVGRINDVTFLKMVDDNIDDMVANILFLSDEPKLAEITRMVKTFYLKNKPINTENYYNLVDLMTDLGEVFYNRKIVDLRNQHSTASTYLYKFSYQGSQKTFYQVYEGTQCLQGVAHADEMSYTFYMSQIKAFYENNDVYPAEGTKDRLIIERFVRMWYNFAATGNPTPRIDETYLTTEWKASNKQSLYYLDIGENLVLKDDSQSENRKVYEMFKDKFLGL